MNDFYNSEDFDAYANGSYYGGFRTRTFAQIFPSFEQFETEYNATSLKIEFNNYFKLSDLYYMLYAHYGNSHISFTDENQFKYYMYSIIYQHGPRVLKKREIQMEMTKITLEEAQIGGKAIYNHAYNPSTTPSQDYLEGLPYINDQNTTNYKKSKLEGLSILNASLSSDLIDEFIHRFKRLFIKVLAPDYPLLYNTEV